MVGLLTVISRLRVPPLGAKFAPCLGRLPTPQLDFVLRLTWSLKQPLRTKLALGVTLPPQ